MSVILKTPSNGSVTLAEQDTASDVVVTVPAVTATLLNNSSGVMNIGSGQVVKDASGNLGLGVTPSAWSYGGKGVELTNNGFIVSAGPNISMFANLYFNGSQYVYKTSAAASFYDQTSGAHKWWTAPSGTAGNAISFTQAMTLDASGNLSLGLTGTGGRLSVKGAASSQVGYFETSTAGFGFRLLTNGSDVGSIIMGASSTSFNTSSDYRLKENVAPMTGALATVAALKPCTYTWKSTGEVGQGFIAHELQAVVPDCVTGEKDAVEIVDDFDADGNKIGTKEVPRYQGVDTSFLVATLVSAIQEQQAIITQLQADVAALQGAA